MVRLWLIALVACRGLNPAFCPDTDEACLAVAQCANGIDDDQDGLSDLADPGCFGAEDGDELGELACDDGADSDADGLIDLADPGCSGPGDSDEHSIDLMCDDGLDNDVDGRADFRANGTGDACCTSPTTTDENCPCVTQITAGASHTCALKLGANNNQAPSCWGDNAKGQVGDNSTTKRPSPTPVSQLASALEIVAGGLTTCARKVDGTAVCWGLGDAGQLGNGGGDSLVPVPVRELETVVQLAVGDKHACARLDDGTAACWGDGGKGQLGNGSTTSRSSPVAVSTLAQIVDLDAGSTHTCAVLNDGTVWCWGENDKGQLGSGSADSLTPVQVTALTTATAVSAGEKYSCALLMDQTVACWGDDTKGKLGDGGGFVSRTTPEVIAGLVGVTQLSAGATHACAVQETGAVACWGDNASGQVGSNAGAEAASPVAVAITEASSVTTGREHTCATRNDQTGVVQCWGTNKDGQLGTNGGPGGSAIPVISLLTCP